MFSVLTPSFSGTISCNLRENILYSYGACSYGPLFIKTAK